MSGKSAGKMPALPARTGSAGILPALDRAAFFAGVRADPFGGSMTQAQVEGLAVLLDVWEQGFGADDRRWLAYALATVFHETAATMQPIEEIGHGRGHAYGVPAGPWHRVYDGRGDVQLTWAGNYRKAAAMLKRAFGIIVDLEQHPEQAMQPRLAALILFQGMIEGLFTGKGFAAYFPPGKPESAKAAANARRIINGTDRAALIAGYYRAFLKAIQAATAPLHPASNHGDTP